RIALAIVARAGGSVAPLRGALAVGATRMAGVPRAALDARLHLHALLVVAADPVRGAVPRRHGRLAPAAVAQPRDALDVSRAGLSNLLDAMLARGALQRRRTAGIAGVSGLDRRRGRHTGIAGALAGVALGVGRAVRSDASQADLLGRV